MSGCTCASCRAMAAAAVSATLDHVSRRHYHEDDVPLVRAVEVLEAIAAGNTARPYDIVRSLAAVDTRPTSSTVVAYGIRVMGLYASKCRVAPFPIPPHCEPFVARFRLAMTWMGVVTAFDALRIYNDEGDGTTDEIAAALSGRPSIGRHSRPRVKRRVDNDDEVAAEGPLLEDKLRVLNHFSDLIQQASTEALVGAVGLQEDLAKIKAGTGGDSLVRFLSSPASSLAWVGCLRTSPFQWEPVSGVFREVSGWAVPPLCHPWFRVKQSLLCRQPTRLPLVRHFLP